MVFYYWDILASCIRINQSFQHEINKQLYERWSTKDFLSDQMWVLIDKRFKDALNIFDLGHCKDDVALTEMGVEVFIVKQVCDRWSGASPML